MLLIPVHEIDEGNLDQVLDDYFQAGNNPTLYGWIDIHHYYEAEDNIKTDIWVSFGSFEDAQVFEDNIEIIPTKKGRITFEAYVDVGGHLSIGPTNISTIYDYLHIDYGRAHNYDDERVTCQLFFLF